MFCHNNKAFLFGLPKDAAGAAFKRWLRLLALANNKIGSGSNSTLKELAPGGSGSATLVHGSICQCNVISEPRYVNASICQHLDMSTPQYDNISICQRLNMSTPRYVNASICQRLDMSKPQYVNASIYQRFNVPTPRYVNASMCQRLNMSTPQYVNATICQCLNMSMPWYVNGLITQISAFHTNQKAKNNTHELEKLLHKKSWHNASGVGNNNRCNAAVGVIIPKYGKRHQFMGLEWKNLGLILPFYFCIK